MSPATRVLWRAPNSVQLELGARRVRLDGIDRTLVRHLLAGDAERQPSGAPSVAVDDTFDQDTVRALVDQGFVWSPADARRPIDGTDERRVPPAPRLYAELSALTVQYGPRAATVLAARSAARVVVSGDSHVGPQVVAVLAAAGVGHVSLIDPSPTRLEHLAPAGATVADEGRPLAAVAADAAARSGPGVDTVPPAYGTRPDLVVIATPHPVDDERREALHGRGCAHLIVGSGPACVVVGPLVVPGLTSCLRCADLHRLDRDPAWNALAVQLAQPRRGQLGAAAATGILAAGMAAIQVLDFLDGRWPAAIEGSLELHPPDWRIRRRSWPPHPECGCTSDAPAAS